MEQTMIARKKRWRHLLCMGPRYWILTKSAKTIIVERYLENCTKDERDIFMCDMWAREEILTALPKIEYNQVKSLATSHFIWKALENSFKGDAHSKNLRLKSWICAFWDAKMMEDESVRTYIDRISEITTSIRCQGGTKQDDEVYGRYWRL